MSSSGFKDVKGFEARNIRFCSVRELSIFDEYVFWIIKVRQLAYFLLAAFILFTASDRMLLFSALFALFAVFAAFYPAKTLSFEAYVLGAILNSIPTRKRVRVKLEKPEMAGSGVEVGIEYFEPVDEEDKEDISKTRIFSEMLKKETRKVG